VLVARVLHLQVTIAQVVTAAPAKPHLHLIVGCCTLKGSCSDWLVEKATELGAHILSPLLTERSPDLPGATQADEAILAAQADSNGAPGATGRLARWRRVAVAAVKQSLRVHGLCVSQAMRLDNVLELISLPGTVALVAAEGGAAVLRALRSAADQRQLSRDHGHNTAAGSTVEHVLLIVGPEGDFTISELQQLEDAGASLVGLGSLRLRTETAAVAMLAACMMHFDAFESDHSRMLGACD
jgi:16S rRNA (uracil1498-N3)-methyltransferase